jgi:general stress protein 26
MDLPENLVELLRKPSLCFITTLMTDGKHIVINTVDGFQKVRNVARDSRVAVAIADKDNPSSYVAVRGRVVEVTEQGGAEHIDKLAHKYLGGPYPWFGGRDQVRVIMTIEAEKVSAMG